MDKIIFIFEILLFIIVFGCILFIAYVSTRFIGNKASNTMKGKNMQVLESISLGMDKSLYLVKTGNKCFVISISGKTINYITDINMEDIDLTPDQKEENDFYNVLSKRLRFIGKNKKTHKANKDNDKSNINSNKMDNTLLKNVSRLKKTTQRFNNLNNDQITGDEKNND